jgi:hypothetical protein
VTEALKTSNIKTVLFILRTIDKEGRKLSTSDDATYILMPKTLVPKTRDISASAKTVTSPPPSKELAPSLKTEIYPFAKHPNVLDH